MLKSLSPLEGEKTRSRSGSTATRALQLRIYESRKEAAFGAAGNDAKGFDL